MAENGKAKIENGKARTLRFLGAKFDWEKRDGANEYF
jgi:hypothetical protein